MFAMQGATRMDIVMLARRCATNSVEKLKRDDQLNELNAAFANMFGEKINAYKFVRKERAQLASGENEHRNHMLNERVPAWMGRISAKKNSTQKCNFERPEKNIPVVVVD